jgi:hypothetical protein
MFEWRVYVLPMGLSICKCTSSSPILILIGDESILNKFVSIYLDDILMFSRTKEKQYTHLDTHSFSVCFGEFPGLFQVAASVRDSFHDKRQKQQYCM